MSHLLIYLQWEDSNFVHSLSPMACWVSIIIIQGGSRRYLGLFDESECGHLVTAILTKFCEWSICKPLSSDEGSVVVRGSLYRKLT